jgi:glycerate dehydrogenase
MKIKFLDTNTIGEVENLNRISELGEFIKYPDTSKHELSVRVQDADIIITNKVRIDRETIDAASDLKLICVAATGVNNVDLEYAAQKNIPVKNVEGYSTNSVAQSAFAMILYLLHHPDYYKEYVFSGAYAHSPLFTHIGKPFWELSNKRFGIIGLGTIGKKVAQIAESFGCEVVYYSTSGRNKEQPYTQLSLEELLETSDIVSIHAPLNEQTKHLLSYQQLSLMQSHALLINTGRGGIVIEADLAHALDEGIIGGAALDVLVNEPINADNPLLHIKNKDKLFIAPHIAWTSNESRKLLVDKLYQNIAGFIETL